MYSSEIKASKKCKMEHIEMWCLYFLLCEFTLALPYNVQGSANQVLDNKKIQVGHILAFILELALRTKMSQMHQNSHTGYVFIHYVSTHKGYICFM